VALAAAPGHARGSRLNVLRAGLTLLVGAYGVFCALTPSAYGFLDGVDLIVHEAGHVVFAPLGEFIGVLGGTLMQLLLPAGIAFSFARQGQPHAATVTLVWLAQSLFNVSVYVRDARPQALPLLGGGLHDWSYLLGRLHLLAWDGVIGGLVYLLGVATLLVALSGGLVLSFDAGADAAAKERG
jgi:hypothetical protein